MTNKVDEFISFSNHSNQQIRLNSTGKNTNKTVTIVLIFKADFMPAHYCI